MIWIRSFTSALAALLLTFSSVCWGGTAKLSILNGTSNTVAVAAATVPPYGSLTWHTPDMLTTNSIGGTNVGTWTPSESSEYTVLFGSDGTATIIEATATGFTAFWLGFSLVFTTGLLALAARWIKIIIGGGGDSGGLD